MKTIYICHEYDTKSHFEALYRCADQYGYQLHYIVLMLEPMLHSCARAVIKEHNIKKAFLVFTGWIADHWCLRRLKNEILIVGIAPYNKLMNRYRNVFMRNKAFYFTSFTWWDDDSRPPARGTVKNKEDFVKVLTQNFKGAACISEAAEKGVSPYITNTMVVNHAICTKEYVAKTASDRKGRFLYLGSLSKRKNILLMLDWFQKNRQWSLDLGGGGGEHAGMVSEAARNYDNIHYLGLLAKSDIKNILHEYDFLLLPSEEEPFGIVLLEGLAAGVPCLVSNALGPSEIIRDGCNGFIFDVGCNKEQNFAQMMERAARLSDSEYGLMVRNAEQSSRQYNSEKIIKRWIQLIEAV